MKKALAILFVFLLVMSFAACKGLSDSIVGAWQTPVTVVGDAGDQLFDTNYIILEFREDNTGALTDMSVDVVTPIEFTYSIEGNNLTVESESGETDNATFDINGDSLTIVFEGKTVVYTKY